MAHLELVVIFPVVINVVGDRSFLTEVNKVPASCSMSSSHTRVLI